MEIDNTFSFVSDAVDNCSASVVLSTCMTLDGRVDSAMSVGALSAAEAYAHRQILAVDRSVSRDEGNLVLAFRPHGRLYLLPRGEYIELASHFLFVCYVKFETWEIEHFNELRGIESSQLEKDRGTICNGFDKDDGYEAVSDHLLEVAEHMAPLILYCGQVTVSNFYSVGKSALSFEITLDEACRQVREQMERAPIEILTIVFCAHILLRSGTYARLEEFNAAQLSIDNLVQFFQTKRLMYQQETSIALVGDFEQARSIQDKADWLRQARESVLASLRIVRLINGANLKKQEAILPLGPTPVASSFAGLGPTSPVRLLIETAIKRLFPDRDYVSVDDVISDRFALHADCPFTTPLEALIDQVVAAAVEATTSDFGMTRGVRDFRAFEHLLRTGKAVEAAAWSQAEYFCHVVGSEKICDRMPKKEVLANLNAMSARMRYNTWHYTPSYFNVRQVPPDRPWFFAPRMADIADHSDQHHTGHKHASVKYSIRSPLPVRIGSQILPGLIDLRLMRQTGVPFETPDLITAILYTEALQTLYQELVNRLAADAKTQFKFTFGNKAAFETIYLWRDLGTRAVCMPTETLPGEGRAMPTVVVSNLSDALTSQGVSP